MVLACGCEEYAAVDGQIFEGSPVLKARTRQNLDGGSGGGDDDDDDDDDDGDDDDDDDGDDDGDDNDGDWQ